MASTVTQETKKCSLPSKTCRELVDNACRWWEWREESGEVEGGGGHKAQWSWGAPEAKQSLSALRSRHIRERRGGRVDNKGQGHEDG